VLEDTGDQPPAAPPAARGPRPVRISAAEMAATPVVMAMDTTAPIAMAAPTSTSTQDPTSEPWRDDLFASALDLRSLTPEQRVSVQSLIARRQTATDEVRTARAALVNALASQLEAGTPGTLALAPEIQAVVSAMRRAEPANRELLETLHATLSGPQRAELVASAESKIEMVQGQDGDDPRPDLGWIGRNVNLTPDQTSKAETRLASLREPPEMGKAEAQARSMRTLEAFKGTGFVGSEAALTDAAHRRINRLVGVVQAVAPVLSAEQRAAAAAALREAARSI